jgi:NADH dehydrogenase/NADH:ubiquinone oxidoreductase subunit G
VATVTQASLQAAAGRHDASVAGRALDKQQTALAGDLRAAMSKAGIKLSGAVEFSVSSNGAVSTKGSDADKAAMTAFLKADTSKPGFAARIATQAQDALKLSATIQQTAAISQAARYGGKSGVMSMYASLMQQTNTTAAVFTVAAGSSSLTYPGALAAKA